MSGAPTFLHLSSTLHYTIETFVDKAIYEGFLVSGYRACRPLILNSDKYERSVGLRQLNRYLQIELLSIPA
jgi:hypothetical protein